MCTHQFKNGNGNRRNTQLKPDQIGQNAQALREGKTRKEVALLLGVGYGFVQNVYAKYFNNRPLSPEGDFVFNRTFGVELEIVHGNKRQLRNAIRRRGVACEIEGYNHATRTNWKIVSDASVIGGYELVSPVLKGERGLAEVNKPSKRSTPRSTNPAASTPISAHRTSRKTFPSGATFSPTTRRSKPTSTPLCLRAAETTAIARR